MPPGVRLEIMLVGYESLRSGMLAPAPDAVAVTRAPLLDLDSRDRLRLRLLALAAGATAARGSDLVGRLGRNREGEEPGEGLELLGRERCGR